MNTEKFKDIRVNGFNGKWSAVDEYSDGESDYILLECISFRMGVPNLICQVTASGELIMIGKTYECRLSDALINLQKGC